MLHIPINSSNILTMIGIDPGSSKMGLSVLKFNVDTMEIVSTRSMTFIGKNFIKDSWVPEVHGERFARIQAIMDKIYQVLLLEKPFMITSEAPFFNPRTPEAFQALVEVLNVLKMKIFQYDPLLVLNTIQPAQVKKSVFAKVGISDKDDVKKAVLSLPDLKYIGHIPLDQLDDNAIDSLAVVWGQFQLLKGASCFQM